MDKKIIIGAVVAILVVVVAAFALMGGSSDSDPTHLTVAAHSNIKEPSSGFDPLTGWGCGHQNYNPLVQSCLFKTDVNGTIVPDLATDYSVSSDGKTWTVNLRDDVKFSDNSTFNAKDVEKTFNTAINTESDLDLTNLEKVTAKNDTCVEFKLVEPRSTFIYDLRYVGIVPEEYDNNTYGENPIGTGPYVLDHWDKGQQAIFKVNDNYYGDKPYFTQITLLFPEESTWLELAKSGQVDVVPVATSALNQSVDGYQFVEKSAGRAQGVSFPYLEDNGNVSPEGGYKIGNNVTADKAIRQALNVGVNRQAMCDDIFSGHASPEYTGVDTRDYANHNAYVNDSDVEQAKQILKEGGWEDTDGDGIVDKNGTKASFDLYYPPDYLDRQSLSTVFAEQAKEIGIEVNLKGADWDTIYANMYSSAALMQQTSPDPYKSIYQQYHSKEADDFYMNPGLYNNTAVDTVMEEAMHSTDFDAANELWSESALTGDGGWGPAGDAPFAWLVNYDYNYFIKDGIDIGKQPDGLGNDVLINICDWTRTNSTA